MGLEVVQRLKNDPARRSNSDLTVKGTHISNNPVARHLRAYRQRDAANTHRPVARTRRGVWNLFHRGLPNDQQSLGRRLGIGGHRNLGGCANIFGGSLFDNFYAGIRVTNSGAFVSGTQIFNTHPRSSDGAFGDGVIATLSNVTLAGLDIEGSERAGITSVGSDVSSQATLLNCNAIDLDGEMFGAALPVINDLGGNTCKCGEHVVACQVKSLNLAPPDSLTEPE